MPDFTLPAGCIPIVCTPFRDDESIDHDSLRREVDWLVSQGATGLATLALASEGYKLTDAGYTASAEILLNDALPFLVWSMQTLDYSVFTAKQQMHRMGIFTSPDLRQPAISFDRITHRRLNQHLDNLRTPRT